MSSIEQIDNKFTEIYSQADTNRLEPIQSRRRFFSCLLTEENELYCKQNFYVDSFKATKNISICKYIPEALVEKTLWHLHGAKYIK
jgi:hypothetical protein